MKFIKYKYIYIDSIHIYKKQTHKSPEKPSEKGMSASTLHGLTVPTLLPGPSRAITRRFQLAATVVANLGGCTNAGGDIFGI